MALLRDIRELLDQPWPAGKISVSARDEMQGCFDLLQEQPNDILFVELSWRASKYSLAAWLKAAQYHQPGLEILEQQVDMLRVRRADGAEQRIDAVVPYSRNAPLVYPRLEGETRPLLVIFNQPLPGALRLGLSYVAQASALCLCLFRCLDTHTNPDLVTLWNMMRRYVSELNTMRDNQTSAPSCN